MSSAARLGSAVRFTIIGACLLGCGDETPEAPALPAATEVAELCAQLAEADCARIDACGFLGAGLARADCELRQRDRLCAPFARALTRAEQGGEGTWLASAGRRCVLAVGAAGCDRGLDYDLLAISACAEAFQPRATEGETCSFVGSCVENTFCDVRTSCPGVCRRLGQVNESCGPSRPCVEGAYCSLTAMVCLAPSDLGADCETLTVGPSCRPGSFCDGSQPGGARCVASRGRGSGCRSDAECAIGLACLRNRCSAGALQDACVDDTDCVADLRCSGGSCAEPGAPGAACSVPTDCEVGLVCGPDGCEVGVDEGADCSERPCARGRCVADLCVPPSADGDGCAEAADCLSGRTCLEGTCRALGPFCPI